MVAPVSAWGKPGAWALDAEEHEAAMAVHSVKDDDDASSDASQQQEFPSLAAAAAAKPSKKKKKGQSISLAEFTNGKSVSHGAGGRLPVSSSSKGLGIEEPLQLPTGPRERSAEEIERLSSRGFGYSSYGGARGRGPAAGEDSNPTRWGSSRDSDEPRRGGFGGSNRDLEPSRADETDDWGAAKKSVVPERRERGTGGGFFDSQSRADESDSWISTKSAAPPFDGRRIGSGAGFGAARERGGGFDFNKEGSNGGGADSETWGRKKDFTDLEKWSREEDKSSGSGGRPRLVLQPRSLPLSTINNGEQLQEKESTMEMKSKGTNPFGQARPREEVLAEKGLDWKIIDEKLEAMKIRDAPPERSTFGKKGFGEGIGTQTSPENSTDRSWRKPNTAEASQPSEDMVANSVSES